MTDLAYSIRQAWINEPPLRERPWHTRVMFKVWRLCGFREVM